MSDALGKKKGGDNDKKGDPLATDTDQLVKEFKAEYKEKGNRDLFYQVPYLSALAHRYQEKADWPSLLRAHSLYNSCAVRDSENREQWVERAYQVQLNCWGNDLQTFSQHLHVIQILKCEVEKIRDRRKKQAEKTLALFQKLDCDVAELSSPNNQELYTQILTDIPHLSNSVNQDMIRFTKSVIEKALAICGPPVCKYCVVALGSLARGEATPYSDLEFLILVEKKSDEIVRCFERFSVTIYFLVGNLGETKLKYMAIPELMSYSNFSKRSEHWFTDLAMSGFKIDGLGVKAGNIPTGNGSVEQENHFICTVQELAGRYKSVLDHPDPEKSLTGDLTAMLSSTMFISGEQSLHDSLRSLIASYYPNKHRETATVRMMESDANNFNFQPDTDLTHTRHLKNDIHRYPSLLILNLKIMHSIQSCEPWEIIQLLERRAVITSQAAMCLKFSLCCAQIIRLSAYFYYNSQHEDISVLSSQAGDNLYKGAWYLRPELLVHMFIHLLPLKEAVSKITTSNAFHAITISVQITMHEAVALTRYYCKEYHKALESLRTQYPDGLQLSDTFTQHMYIRSAIKCNHFAEAERLLIMRIQSQCYDEFDFHLLGRLYEHQCQLSRAIDCYTTQLSVLISLYGFTDHADIARAYCSIGLVLGKQSEYTQSLECLTRCLNMWLKVYGDRDHENLTLVFENIGLVLHDQGKYSQALEYHTKCLDMRLKMYGDRDHMQIAQAICNIGLVLLRQSNYSKALEYFSKCLDMSLRIYGDGDHKLIAGVLNNIGIVLHRQNKSSQALEYYTKSLDMLFRMYGGRDREQIAKVLGSIGQVLSMQSKYNQALEYYEKSLDMRQRIHGDRDHKGIAHVIHRIGEVLDEQMNYSGALVNYTESLDMYIRIFGDVDHSRINSVRNRIRRVENFMEI